MVPPSNLIYDPSKNWSSDNIFLKDKISLSDSLYFLRYWHMCIAIFCSEKIREQKKF